MDYDENTRYEVGWAWLFLDKRLNLTITAAACTLFGLPLLKLTALWIVTLTLVNLMHNIMRKQNILEKSIRNITDITEGAALKDKSSTDEILKKLESIERELLR